MIVKYISELLFDRECVIIPEFGAFITKETPATLDYANHRLTPPSKEVVFNSQLVADDGVLVDYMRVRMKITREESAQKIHDFAMQSLAVIESGESLHLEGIGTLERINSKDFSLRLDEKVNFMGDAFGLCAFSVQPVYRNETYQHIATKIANEQKAKNTMMTVHDEKVERPHRVNRYNYKWFRAAAYSMTIALLLVLLGWGADKRDSNLASWNPFFYSSPNEFIVKHLGGRIEAEKLENIITLPSLELSIPVFKNEVDYLQPRDFQVYKPTKANAYYIIGASVRNEDDAQKCVSKFQKIGFEDAVALPMNEQGNVRVAYELVTGKEAALKRLEIIKKEFNEDAWMLRKK